MGYPYTYEEQEEAKDFAEFQKDLARYARLKVSQGKLDGSVLKRFEHIEVEDDLTEDELSFLDDLKAYKQSRKDRGL